MSPSNDEPHQLHNADQIADPLQGSPGDGSAADLPIAENGQGQKSPRRNRKQLLLIFAIIIFAVLASAIGGYAVGNKQGEQEREAALKQAVEEQFNLAVVDLEAGRYALARQRLDYIRNLNPNYPQLAELLAQALLALNAPTGTPVPIHSPTPNLAPVQELFEQAESALAEANWGLTLELLLGLRAKDADYRAIEVDGMIFTALRNRGMQNITNGLMEVGLFDLSLASLFGPLDINAINSQSLAEQYILANSYYGIDWATSTDLFFTLCAQGATYDACFKYGNSAKFYGDLLYSLKDPCAAQEQYDNSLNAWGNPDLEPTATKAAKACLTATAPAPVIPTEETTPELTPDGTPATETPTPSPSATLDDGGS